MSGTRDIRNQSQEDPIAVVTKSFPLQIPSHQPKKPEDFPGRSDSLPIRPSVGKTRLDFINTSTVSEATGPLQSDDAIIQLSSLSRNLTSEPECDHGVKLSDPNVMFQESQKECEILREEVRNLKKNLQDAQDFIFSLQPRQQNLTETEAATEFKSLCASIEEMVDSKLGEALDAGILTKKTGVPLDMSERLLSLIPRHGKEAFRYPETDEYNIISAILHYLCDNIFNLEFYCPVGEIETRFMNSIQRSMRNLEPPRDIRTCRSWRSETYTAITHLPEFEQWRERRKNDITSDLSEMLGLFTRDSLRDLQITVHNTIVEPAFKLAHKMHLSVDRFGIEWSPYNDESEQRTFRFKEDVEIVDLSNRKTLKSSPSGHIKFMLDITPRLVIYKVKADAYLEPKTLKKSKILVTVMKEAHGYNRESKIPPKDATVLGWLNDQVHSFMRQKRLHR